MADPFRCSTASAARDEPMAGTASTVRSWLLLEHAGPWGVDAFVDARLPEAFGTDLAERCRLARVRPLLIRRIGANVTTGANATIGVSCFAIRSGPEPPWIERTTLDRIEEAFELDLEALGRGERPGLEPHADALFLVCTHGRHDACCAERGRPLAQALARAYPDQTWECSHIGGDRFAGNVVAFPHGRYFGRVEAEAGAFVARAYLDGRIDLEHDRGRSCRSMPVQAAEHELRVAERLDREDDVELERASRTERGWSVTFRTPAGARSVEVEILRSEPRRITCRGEGDARVPVYRVRPKDAG